MKKIYRYFFAAVAIASAASCADQLGDNQAPAGQIPAEFAQMTISASLGEVTKTTYDNQSVLWEGTESITVFSKGSENSPAQFDMDWCSEDKTKASFTGLADLNAESYYAVYPHSATNACTSEGVLTVNIPAEQTAVAGGFASGANVAVAGFAKDDANVVFNNVSSLLSFGFETDADAILTKSVTVKMKNETGYINIAGNVSVSYNPEGDLVVSEGTTDNIVLTAPTGGFAKGVTYYVLVAPVGQIAEMELIYTHTDGTTTCTRKNSNIIASLSRSTLVPLETIPVAYDDLPQEDFEVVFDFTGEWPFSPACLASGEQSKDTEDDYGDEYTYTYFYGEDQSVDLTTILKRGASSAARRIGYAHLDGSLIFRGVGTDMVTPSNGNASAFISTPIINARYITNIVMQIDFPANYSSDSNLIEFYFNDLVDDAYVSKKIDAYNVSKSSREETITVELPYNTYGRSLGDWVNIKLRSANILIKSIKMTYSKNITD